MIRMILSLLCVVFFLSGFLYGDQNWPSFRGKNGDGVSEGFKTVEDWDVEASENVLWKTYIQGLAHSCPVIWGDKLFVTTAVSDTGYQSLKVGRYGAGGSPEDKGEFSWRIYCLDKKTGKTLWFKIASEGPLKVKRHTKSSHASATPCTDGKHVVAYFESEGLYCYDMEGDLKWKKDLGIIDLGPFNGTHLQWGGGSSPVIHENMVILQCDKKDQSYLAAFHVETGEEIWKTLREEDTTWCTPAVHTGPHPQIIANGYKHIGGYDIKTGKEIWKMKGGGDIPVPTPIVAHDLIYITNAHGRMAPIYAIKTSAKGDISLEGEATKNEHIAWSYRREGIYIPSPIHYKGYLYFCSDIGVLTCWEAKTGKMVYRKKFGRKPSFSASPVIADNKLYCTGEKGDIYVFKVGPEFDLLSKNMMEETCMATPAVSQGVIYFRTRSHVIAVGEKKAE